MSDQPVVTPKDMKELGLRALLAGPARALDLLKRLPEYFAKRGWPTDTDHVVVAIGAIGCVVVGARAQAWKIPQPAIDEKWSELGERATSAAIVEKLELEPYCKP